MFGELSLQQAIILTIHSVVNKYAPIKLASHAKQEQLNKPWNTKGIHKSIKLKQKMYCTHFSSYDLKLLFMKNTNPNPNTLLRLISRSKKEYFKSQFARQKWNLKST